MADGHGLSVEEIRAVLTGESPFLANQRRRFRRIPSDPRCKLCEAPFGGVGGMLLKPAGYAPYPGNPSICSKCVVEMRKRGMSGLEIPVSLLFTDVRGSTAMAERMRPGDFHAFLHHFYRLASGAISTHRGIVDKIVGDEVIGLFFGGVSGPRHAAAAVDAALDLAARIRRPDATPSGPIPAGTAVHTGEAFVGASRTDGDLDDFTALGDAVNTAARLASTARAGEVIVSAAAAEAAGIDTPLARRSVPIRGRSEPIDVLVLRAAEPGLGVPEPRR